MRTRSQLQIITRNQLNLIQSAALAQLPWLVHGFSLRYARCGPGHNSARRRAREFNMGFTANARRSEVEENRRRFVRAVDPTAIAASLHQVHSATVWEVARARESGTRDSTERQSTTPMLQYRPAGSSLAVADDSEVQHAGDALIASESGILLTIRVADCLPVLIADRRLRVIAAVHAGWRGALARVIGKTAGELHRAFGSRPADLIAVLGPAIGRCCYEVGEEVIDAFRGQFRESDAFFHKPAAETEPQRSDLRYTLLFHTQAPPGHRRERRGLHLDLIAVARAQLREAGLNADAIHAAEYCTCCHPGLFFSHRRDAGRAGRMMAVLGIRG